MAKSLTSSLGPWALIRLFRAFEAADHPLRGSFVGTMAEAITDLGLKERVDVIADAIAERLPDPFDQALPIVLRAADNWDEDPQDDQLGTFAAWPLVRFVAKYGQAHPELAVPALTQLNLLFTAEFAVREFIAADPDATYAQILAWTASEQPELRRLASETTRSRLPWATRLPWIDAHPEKMVALLDRLIDDTHKSVRTSVSNHLNDLSKDHPELALETATRWLEGASTPRRRLVQRGLRTLVKQGHPRVWKLLGYTPQPRLTVSALTVSRPAVDLRRSVDFELTFTSTARKAQRFHVDFVVHYVKASGQTSPKVFKWRVINLEPDASITLTRTLAMIPRSTRTLYPGEHRVEVRVNAKPVAEASFELRPF